MAAKVDVKVRPAQVPSLFNHLSHEIDRRTGTPIAKDLIPALNWIMRGLENYTFDGDRSADKAFTLVLRAGEPDGLIQWSYVTDKGQRREEEQNIGSGQVREVQQIVEAWQHEEVKGSGTGQK
jgi:hypothetical protein